MRLPSRARARLLDLMTVLMARDNPAFMRKLAVLLLIVFHKICLKNTADVLNY